jgi:hypothetical protein
VSWSPPISAVEDGSTDRATKSHRMYTYIENIVTRGQTHTQRNGLKLKRSENKTTEHKTTASTVQVTPANVRTHHRHYF